MRRTSEKLLATGLTAAMALGGCGSGEVNDYERKEPVVLRVATDYDIQTYEHPYDKNYDPGAKAGMLKIGSNVLAICLMHASVPEFSTIRVQVNDAVSYAGVYGPEGSNDVTPTLQFGQDLDALKSQLPLCPSDIFSTN